MVKIRIKIEDLFDKLNIKSSSLELTNDIKSISPPINISIKSVTDEFTPITELIMKRVDSYIITLSDGYTFIASLNHTLLTSNGEKQIKNITSHDYLNDDAYITDISLHKKNDILYDISIPYPHLFKDSHGIVHHNSLVLTYIWKILYEHSKISNVILVVPTINLVTQFKSDMIDYGIDEDIIGEVYGDVKEWNKSIVISTWQTLINNLDKLDLFDSIFVDEVHLVKAASLNTILQNCGHMDYRIGCTGTLPDNRLENLNIKSYLGPVTKEYPISYLIDKGYLAECVVKRYHIHYTDKIEGNYNEVKDAVFEKEYRLNLIANIIKSVGDNNILLLVGKIEKEGELLENYLNQREEFKDHQIKFIYSKTKPNEREVWRQKCITDKKVILIAVYQLFQLGINIPNLNHVGLLSSNKAKIRTLQSIGRSLRKIGDTKATIYDIIDYGNKFLPKHAKERLKYYTDAEFTVKDIELKE